MSNPFDTSYANTGGSTQTSNPFNTRYASGVTNRGFSYGPSSQRDASGRPFLDYRNSGDTSTTTDKTRVATEFDPTKPQVLDKDSFHTPRAVASRAQLKESMGGSYSDELDHSIALELAGSNDKSNLQIQPGLKGGAAAKSDTMENSLAKDVASGKKSLFQAQSELAVEKGLPLPNTGSKYGEYLQQANQAEKESGQANSALGIAENTVKGLPQATLDTIKNMGQMSWRAFGGVASMLTGKPLIPQGEFQKQLYGTDQPITLESTGRELRMANPNVSSQGIFKKIDPALGLISGTLDAIPGGEEIRGLFNMSKEARVAIAGSKDVGEIASILKKEVPALSDEIAGTFSKIFVHMNNPQDVETALNRIKMSVQEAEKAAKLKNVQEEVPEVKTLGEAARNGEIVPRETSSKQKYLSEINPNQSTKLTATESAPIAEKAANQYWNEKIAPDIKEGNPIVIGADDLKDHFGGDYNDNNHPVYSRAAYLQYERALKESNDPTVVLTGGGPASGKTELVVNSLKSQGFKGIIYDSNMANYDGVVKQIDAAKVAGKNVEINGVVPDLESARTFSIQRENATGRGISDATFARGHAGFPSVTLRLLEEGKIKPENVHIIDTRGLKTYQEVNQKLANNDFVKDPIAFLKELNYSENNIKQTYAKANFNKQGYRENGSSVREESSQTSAQSGSNQGNANGQGNGRTLELTSEKSLNREQPKELDLRESGNHTSDKTAESQLSPLAKETLGSQLQIIQDTHIKGTPEGELNTSYIKTLIDTNTPVKVKVGLLDYLRTPDRVLKKIGLEKISVSLRKGYDAYLKELPLHLEQITEWSKSVPKEANQKIFKYLDGQKVELHGKELEVAGEIKDYLKVWAQRLGLPEDNQVSHYITHIFEIGEKQKEFPEEIANLIKNKVPGSVYDPFLEKRLGAKGYVENTWRALDAYVKRAVRKANMDPALEQMKRAASRLEESQLIYVTRLGARINMRPTEWDNLLDNTIKQIVGYRFGQRPVALISSTLRKMVSRGALGLNINSAIKNLTQGVNTFAKLGTRDTLSGYINLLKPGSSSELEKSGILKESFIQDRTLSATKQIMQKVDKGLYAMFETAEYINRGSAYFGAKAKAIRAGLSEEKAVEYAKKIVRDTQFMFGSIDTPVGMQGDIAKTIFQFGNFTQKQTEFLTEMVKNKEVGGLIRYTLASLAVVYTIGKIFNIKGSDFNPYGNVVSLTSKFGQPPSLALPNAIFRAITNVPDQYGKIPSLGQKVKSVASSLKSYIPGGVQLSKFLPAISIPGISPSKKGKSKAKVQAHF